MSLINILFIYFQSQSGAEFEHSPNPERLINTQIPRVITEFPSIEAPNKFEDLLHDPKIVFKSISGTENRLGAKVIKRLKEKSSKPSKMDRARDLVRTRLQKGHRTTTTSPFITAIPAPSSTVTRRTKNPKPFSKLNSKSTVFGQPSTTLTSLISASTTTPRPRQTTLSMQDKMMSARNRLRQLMGQKAIGIDIRKPRPTRPTPSPPTPMNIARLKVLARLEEDKQIEMHNEALEELKVTQGPRDLVLPKVVLNGQDLITVTAKSTFGDFDPSEINPLIALSPTFPPMTTTTTTSRTTPMPATIGPTVEDLPVTTLKSLDHDVMDVPTRMQNTLMRLMRKKGLKRDPLAQLVTTAVSIIDTDQDFFDLTPPTPRQNPFLSKNLRTTPSAGPNIQGLETPKAHQDILLGSLQSDDNGVYQGLTTPAYKQDYLLRQLQGEHSEKPNISPPSERQNYLLGQLQGEHSERLNLTPPSERQNFLLGSLQPDDDGIYQRLTTPAYKQDYLLRQLQGGHSEKPNLSPPSVRQNYLLGQLQGGHSERPNLTPPSERQNLLLGSLQPDDDGIYQGLTTPAYKQDYLLRQLQGGHSEKPNLSPPSQRQNPLIRNLQRLRNDKIQGLTEPSSKQNLLLRQLQGGHTSQVEGLEVPINPIDEPLYRPIKPLNRFNPDGLDLPKKRQNPLLRILRFDRREKILRKGLSPPRYKQNPLFRQLVQTPQRYRNDFLQLPPRQQSNLLEILRKHGGDNFEADNLLTVPRFSNEEPTEEPSDEYEHFEEEFDEEEVRQTPRPSRLRPIMPKSKFEIMQIQKPVEEVTFQRVNSPLTIKDKKEGI
jgi:hypothetical protein